METLHPGVYIQEIPSGLRPIEGVSTSNAAFIGKAQMGTLNKAILVTNPQEFENAYGGYLNDSSLSHAVHDFFSNGGKKAYVIRVAGAGAIAADISINDRKGAKTLTLKAANEGAWGNKLDVVITDGQLDPGNEFTIQVFQDRNDLVPPLLPLLLETHSGQLLVGNGAVALKLGVANGGAETPGAVGTNGASRSAATPSTNPPADERRFLINLDGDGAQQITIPATAATGPAIAEEIQKAVRALTPNNPPNRPAFEGFTATYDDSVAAGNPSYRLLSGTTGVTSTVVVTNSTALQIELPAGVKKFVIDIDGDGPHVVTLPAGALANGAAIAAAIQTAVQALIPKRAANTPAFKPPPAPGFTCTYDTSAAEGNPSLVLTSGTPAGAGRLNSSVRITDAPSDNVAGTLKLGLKNTGSEIGGSAILRPANSKAPANSLPTIPNSRCRRPGSTWKWVTSNAQGGRRSR